MMHNIIVRTILIFLFIIYSKLLFLMFIRFKPLFHILQYFLPEQFPKKRPRHKNSERIYVSEDNITKFHLFDNHLIISN